LEDRAIHSGALQRRNVDGTAQVPSSEPCWIDRGRSPGYPVPVPILREAPGDGAPNMYKG
jgi:hypothetical protein